MFNFAEVEIGSVVKGAGTVDDGGEGDGGGLGKDVGYAAEDGLIACVEGFEDLAVEVVRDEFEAGAYLDVVRR